MPHRRLASLLALLALGAAAGCGGDEAETRASPKPSDLTAPRSTPQPYQTAPQVPPGPPQPPPQTTAPDYENAPSPHPPPPRPDTPENDTPPPPGSPAERFEQECERNPAACG